MDKRLVEPEGPVSAGRWPQTTASVQLAHLAYFLLERAVKNFHSFICTLAFLTSRGVNGADIISETAV